MLGLPFLLGAVMISPQMTEDSPAKIVARCASQLRNAKTISGTYTLRTSGAKTFAGTVNFVLEKDSKIMLEGKNTKEVFDGKMHMVADKGKKTFTLRDVRTTGIPYQVGFEGFPIIKNSPVMSFLNAKRADLRNVDGQSMVAVTGDDRIVYISPESALPMGASLRMGGIQYEMRFSNVVLNPVVTPETFEALLPGDFTQIPFVTPSMIKLGDRALSMENAGQPMLTQFIGEKEKQVLIFTNSNAPSRESVSLMNRFAADLDDSRIGFTVIAQNGKPSGMASSNKALKFINDAALGQNQIASAYGVTQFPSVVVVDQSGKVIHRQVGSETDFLLKVIR